MRWRYLKMSFAWWFGLIWACVGTVFAISGVIMFFAQRDFENRAVNANATIVERGHGTTSKGDSHYWMRYLYRDPDGKEHVDRADVNWSVWRKYSDGDSLPIRYLPENPARNRLNDADAESWWVLPLIFGLVGSTFGGVGWILVGRSFIVSGRRAALMRSGMGALGTVRAVEMNMQVKINNRHPYYLSYEFADETGVKHEGRSPNLPRKLNDRWQPGDPVLIVYDPMDASRHEADIFEMRGDELQMLKRRKGDGT